MIHTVGYMMIQTMVYALVTDTSIGIVVNITIRIDTLIYKP